MANVWIGFHDHADSAPRWIDSRVSYTWLRAFERCEDVNLIAFLREYNYNYDVEHPIRGVRYKFRTTEISAWVDEIVSLNPSLILYNCCWYNAGAMAVEMMRDALKDAIHVIRIHHQVTYLAAQPGFRDFLLSCDVAIAPTAGQMESVRDLGFDGHLYSLPFGINAEAMRHAARPFESRDIHLASAANYHPARNLALVEKVYERLRARGRRVENFSGLPTAQLAEKLGRTKVFWQTSMTEASGSRILPEAIAAGCYPIVFDECLTNRDLILRHGSGTIIVSNIVYDYKQKINTYPDNILEYLTENLDRVISEVEAAGPYVALPIDQAYEEENEINRLTEILHKSEIDWRKPRFNWRSFMNVPVDPDGYAFNPTFFKSALGLVCIYRHVDSGGLRTLRRCLLDSNFGADDYVVWSDELKMLGTDVEWFADPRAFQVGSNFYISFNTGHSESPNHIYSSIG